MPFPDPLAVVYVVYGSDVKGPFVVVLHYFQVGTFPVDQAAAAGLAQAIDPIIGDSLRDVIAADCTYTKTVAYINDGGVSFTSTDNASTGVGRIAGQSMPDYVAAVIQKRTATPGKSGRGRWYVGCVPEAFNNTGVLEPTGVSAYEGFMNNLVADVVVGGGTWRSGHLSRQMEICVPIVGAAVVHQFGTRRKRRLRLL